MEMSRRHFFRLLAGAALGGCHFPGRAGQMLVLPPYPGRILPVCEADLLRPARWAG